MPATARTNASGQTRTEWLDHLGRIGADHGYFDRIAPRHMGLFVQEGDVLIVSFDQAERVFHDREGGLPLGFAAVQRRQMSLLSVMASGDTWFRDPELFAFFDGLSDEGFFDSFDQVVFLGFGPMCGHAASAYSVAAPGASVLVSSPAATLLPERAGFDHRFRKARRKDFGTAYGYAPDLARAARDVVLLYDPFDAPSAAHACQFQGRPVTRVPVPWMGTEIGELFEGRELLLPMLRALVNQRLTRARVHNLLRPVRRAHPAYLWRLAEAAQAAGQFDRAAVVARHGAQVTEDPRFAALAAQLAPNAAPEPAA